jgi:hypothetical protein
LDTPPSAVPCLNLESSDMPDISLRNLTPNEIQAALGEAVKHGLRATLPLYNSEDRNGRHVDLYEEIVGKRIDRDLLAAAMLREFGPPTNPCGWEDQSLGYALSTSRADMVLFIPLDGNSMPAQHFLFSTGLPAEAAVRDWLNRDIDAHWHRFIDWMIGPASEEAPSNGVAHRSRSMQLRAAAEKLHAKDPMGWVREKRQEFEEIEPTPEKRWRSSDWTTWGPEDPASEFIIPVLETLETLSERLGPIAKPERVSSW